MYAHLIWQTKRCNFYKSRANYADGHARFNGDHVGIFWPCKGELWVKSVPKAAQKKKEDFERTKLEKKNQEVGVKYMCV